MRPSGPDHVVPLCGREAAQHGFDALARAAAGVVQGLRLEDRDAALVEQAVQQPLARQRRVDEFVVLDGLGQRLGLGPGIVLAELDREIGRRVAGMEVGLPAAILRLGQELHQQPAGAPAGCLRR